MTGQEFPCTEQGIRDAITEGGGPHTFDCAGPQTVVTDTEIVINNNVILEGEGNLTVDGNLEHRVFSVPAGVNVTLQGIAVARGRVVAVSGGEEATGGGILNEGELLIVNGTIRDSSAEHEEGCYTGEPGTCYSVAGGIRNTFNAQLTLRNTTVSGNSADWSAGGIGNDASATLSMFNCTVSGNTADEEGGIGNGPLATLTLTNSTVSGNSPDQIANYGTATVTNSLIDGECAVDPVTSNGYNIESPGDTCGFDQTGDQSGVSAVLLELQPLADNGGPTMTHALGAGSVAIDQIPEAECEVTTDQRGVTRPQGDACDVGAFEEGQSGIKSGLWLGGDPASNTDGTPFDTGWAICFYVNIDGTFLIPSTDCDVDEDDDDAYMLELSWKNDVGAGTVQGEVGVCNANPAEDSESIGIGDSSGLIGTAEGLADVPIENDSFVIYPGVPGTTRYEIPGTFNGDTASGAASWVWSPGMGFSQCELDGGWTAAPAP